MYEVKIFTSHEDTTGTLIHSPYVSDLKCYFSIDQLLQGISNMELTINMANPAWNMIKPLTTLIKVLNISTGKTEFDGRILKPIQEMNDDGTLAVKYACESKLAYLQDSNQRHTVVQDTTVADFFALLINNHNAQVEPHKRFIVGNVTVTNSTDNVYRYVGYGKTYAEIKDNLIDRLGGYLVLREEVDGTYIDYLQEVGEIKNTPIRLRTNLKSMRREIDPTEIITRLIPLGATLESEEGGTGAVSQPRLTIESVNDGLDYLDDEELQSEFGIISGEVTYDDVTTPSTLKLRGQQYFSNQRAARISYDITPVNLDVIDTSFESFEIGNYHPIINPLFDVEETLQIIEKKINSDNPQSDALTFGDQQVTLTQYQIVNNKRSKKVESLERIVEGQSQRLASIQQELNTVDQALEDVNQAISDADLPALEDAIANLNQAVSDLTDAVDTIPDYNVATPTTDGLMSATDKTKLDGLQNYSNATITTDGLMAKEDKYKLDLITVSNAINLDDLKAKLDLITVVNAIDLDNLKQRVEDLENA